MITEDMVVQYEWCRLKCLSLGTPAPQGVPRSYSSLFFLKLKDCRVSLSEL